MSEIRGTRRKVGRVWRRREIGEEVSDPKAGVKLLVMIH